MSNIMLIVASYLPNIGGLQTVTSSLAMELQQRGHRVNIVTQRYPRKLQFREQVASIQITRLMFLYPRMKNIFSGRLDLLLAGCWYLPITLIQLIFRIFKFKPDVVNLHFVGAQTLFVLLAHKFMPFRLIVSLHGDDVEGLHRGTYFDRWLFRSILRAANRVTACSNYLLTQACAIEPSIKIKAQTIYNGMATSTDLPYVRCESDIVAVGRMVTKKGFDVLLRATAQVAGLRVKMIGEGPELIRLESLARELRIEERVEFCGGLDRVTVLHAMQTCRLVVVPSRQEPFGMTALEALSLGKPVVASRVGGLPEVLQDADAMLIAPDNVNALAIGLKEMLTLLQIQPDFGERNRQIASRFSNNTMVDEYLAVYQTGAGQ